eukprot:g4018.t1
MKRRSSKRLQKKKQHSPEFILCDLNILSEHLEIYLLKNFLSPETLSVLGTTSKYWAKQTSTPFIWYDHCQNLWSDKAYVPTRFLHHPSKESYINSVLDSRRDVLCVDDFEALFAFRFKVCAGSDWISMDPSWELQDNILMLMQILGGFEDVSEEEIEQISANHVLRHHTVDSVETPIVSKQVRQPGPMHVKFTSDHRVVSENLHKPSILEVMINEDYPNIRWRFTKSRNRVKGQFLQINRWPALSIKRLEDWGWQFDSCWVRYRTVCDATENLTFEWLDDRC